MAKYHVENQHKNVWDKSITKDIIALNAEVAREIVTTFHKDAFVTKCVRVGMDSNSTEQDLKGMIEVANCAIRDGAEEIYERQRVAFEETVKNLKSYSNAVVWGITKNHIPEFPVM